MTEGQAGGNTIRSMWITARSFSIKDILKTMLKPLPRHVWEDAKEWVRQNWLRERGRRKETIERSFADTNELHGFRYVWM